MSRKVLSEPAPYRRVRCWIALSLLATSLAACGTGTATLSDLDGVEELKDRFSRDAGAVRIVLLLSPT